MAFTGVEATAELDLQADAMGGSSVPPFTSAVYYVSQPTAISGTQHAGTHLAAAADNTSTTKTPPRHTLLNIGGQSKTGCSSPPLSPATTPTTYSFGPLSPHSFNSTVQTPPATVTSFTHSRESSLDSGGAMSARATLRDPPKGRTQHKRIASSLDLRLRFRHQRVGSRDWDNLAQKMSRLLAVQSPQGFEPLEECVDEDLLKYRQETTPAAKLLVDPASIQDQNTEKAPETVLRPASDSPTETQLEDDAILQSSDDDKNVEDLDLAHNGRSDEAGRVASIIVAEEFGLQLGSAAPPEDIVEAVRQCLAEISLSVQRARGMGALATSTGDIPVSQAASGSATSSPGRGPLESSSSQGKSRCNGRKRFAQDDEGQEDDMEEDGGGGGGSGGNGEGGDLSGYSDAGHRKKPKLEQYPCPFRKRSPHRFNCREWEYCARAPFKSMTELKKHILKYHQQQQFTYKCIRCHAGFTKVDDLQHHMRVDSAVMCSVRPGPPPSLEDDHQITATVGNQLRSRANHYDWTALWRTLFPRDTSVPEPDFEPIIELHEVDHEFQSSLVDFRLQLHSTLDMVLSGWNPPRNAAQLRHVVDGTLENLFQDFVATTFRNVRDKVASESSARPQHEANDTPSHAAKAGVPSPLSLPANTRAVIPTSVLPTRAMPAPATRPKPCAILPHPVPPPAPSTSSSSSSPSVRYSFVSSTGTTVSRSNSSRLRDSITAESVASMSTSAESHAQPQQLPARARQFVLATRQHQQLEPKQSSLRPIAARSSSPLPLHPLNEFNHFGNGDNNRDSGIVPDIIDVDMLPNEEQMLFDGDAAAAGHLEGEEEDFCRYLDLGGVGLGANGTGYDLAAFEAELGF